MSPETCVNCGHAALVERGITIGGSVLPDRYCGYCGANWGVRIKPKPRTDKAQTPRQR